ncbi:hypothetical protein PLESTM_001444800 [Pleodorina starrii]|nr:hypothetical protein PLESTM_001444800 [Pleodorina starrii]
MQLLTMSRSLGVNVVSELPPPVGPPSGAPQAATAAAAASATGHGHRAGADQLAHVPALGLRDLLQRFAEAAALGPAAAALDAADASPSLQDTEGGGASACLFSYDALPYGASLSLHAAAADSAAVAVLPLSLHEHDLPDMAELPNEVSTMATGIAPVTLLSCSNLQRPVWPTQGPCGGGGGPGLGWAANVNVDPWSVAREVAAGAAAAATAAAGGAALGCRCTAPPGAEGADGVANTGPRAPVLPKAAIGSTTAPETVGVYVLDVACADRQLGADCWPPPRRQLVPLGPWDWGPHEHDWQELPDSGRAPLELLPLPLPSAAQRGACACRALADRGNSCGGGGGCFSSLTAAEPQAGPQDPSVLHILLVDDDSGADGDGACASDSIVSLQLWELEDTCTFGGLLGTLDVQPQPRRRQQQLPQGDAVKPPCRSGCCSRANRQEGASSPPRCGAAAAAEEQLDVRPKEEAGGGGGGAVAPAVAVAGCLSAGGPWKVRSTVLGCGCDDSDSSSAAATEDACSCINCCTLWDRSTLPGADSVAPTTSHPQVPCKGMLLSDGRCCDLWVDPAAYGEVASVKRLSSPATRLGQIREV